MKPILKKNVKTIEGHYDEIKDFRYDKNGYFLIRINNNKIEAGHCLKNNEIDFIIKGKKAQDVYKEIINHKLVSRLDHAAYLGKELKKAELALKNKTKYMQE